MRRLVLPNCRVPVDKVERSQGIVQAKFELVQGQQRHGARDENAIKCPLPRNCPSPIQATPVPRSNKAVNPFYVLLVVVGATFTVTACAYGVAVFRSMQVEHREAPNPMLSFFDRHGAVVLGSELGLLAIATFAAIGTDDYWRRRAERHRGSARDDDSVG